MSLPKRGERLPPRTQGETTKSIDEVIKEAPLKTAIIEQTNPEIQPVEQQKVWRQGSNMSVAELMNLTVKKSFNFPVDTQLKIEHVLEAKRKEVRSFGSKKLNETTLVLEILEKGLNAELKKMGIDTKE